MELHSFYQDIWYKLGLVYDAIGNKEKAKEYFSQSKSSTLEIIFFFY